MLLLYFLLLLLLPTIATLLFKSLVAHRIVNDVLRLVAVGLFYVAALLGYLWGILALVIGSAFDLADMYPTVEQPINSTYYFARQEYGFATMMSQGYNLTFYQYRPFWFNKELGKVQLECKGTETIQATITPIRSKYIRLRIATDGRQRLDTAISLSAPFLFRRTLENHNLNFSKRP